MTDNKDDAAPALRLNAGLDTITAGEVAERLLAMEGAVQRVMAIVAMALPHTDSQLSSVDKEWGRIINDIERDYEKVSNAKLTSGATPEGVNDE